MTIRQRFHTLELNDVSIQWIHADAQHACDQEHRDRASFQTPAECSRRLSCAILQHVRQVVARLQ